MYQEKLKQLRSQWIKKGLPFSSMFELTPRCNFRCGFCYVCDRKEQDYVPEKTTEDWLHIIKEAVDYGVLRCSFTGGEIFTRPDFEEIYTKTYEMGVRISLLTNASLIAEKDRTYLKRKKPDSIEITLYGESEDTYKKVTGHGKAFEQVMDNIELLKNDGQTIVIKTLPIRPVYEHLDAMANLIKKLGCSFSTTQYLGPERDDHSHLNTEMRLSAAEADDFITRLVKKGVTQPVERDYRAPAKRCFRCIGSKSSFIINCSGEMQVCPMLSGIKTYPEKTGIPKAWQDLQNIIQKIEGCNECLNCNDYEFCIKCPAKLYAETGEPNQCSDYLKALAAGNRRFYEKDC